eukprot:3105517-Amphidinium_carterae.1
MARDLRPPSRLRVQGVHARAGGCARACGAALCCDALRMHPPQSSWYQRVEKVSQISPQNQLQQQSNGVRLPSWTFARRGGICQESADSLRLTS